MAVLEEPEEPRAVCLTYVGNTADCCLGSKDVVLSSGDHCSLNDDDGSDL